MTTMTKGVTRSFNWKQTKKIGGIFAYVFGCVFNLLGEDHQAAVLLKSSQYELRLGRVPVSNGVRQIIGMTYGSKSPRGLLTGWSIPFFDAYFVQINENTVHCLLPSGEEIEVPVVKNRNEVPADAASILVNGDRGSFLDKDGSEYIFLNGKISKMNFAGGDSVQVTYNGRTEATATLNGRPFAKFQQDNVSVANLQIGEDNYKIEIDGKIPEIVDDHGVKAIAKFIPGISTIYKNNQVFFTAEVQKSEGDSLAFSLLMKRPMDTKYSVIPLSGLNGGKGKTSGEKPFEDPRIELISCTVRAFDGRIRKFKTSNYGNIIFSYDEKYRLIRGVGSRWSLTRHDNANETHYVLNVSDGETVKKPIIFLFKEKFSVKEATEETTK